MSILNTIMATSLLLSILKLSLVLFQFLSFFSGKILILQLLLHICQLLLHFLLVILVDESLLSSLLSEYSSSSTARSPEGRLGYADSILRNKQT